jgi:hypothetical protein
METNHPNRSAGIPAGMLAVGPISRLESRDGRLIAGATALFFALFALAAVVDRIAVIVGSDVITESEVLREVRLTEFLNGQPPDTGPAARRAAAERLVDQQLIRTEMEAGSYPVAPAAQADEMLRSFRQQRFGGDDAALTAALAKYGLSEEELKDHLLWEASVLRFTDARFQIAIGPPPAQSADRVSPGAAMPPAESVDQQLDEWLKQQRAATPIQLKPEAFQ